jgi:excisionase family DNA binding protein
VSRPTSSAGKPPPKGIASQERGLQLTSGELASLLRVDLKTIHNWVNRGHLVGRRTSGRHLRFDRIQVVRFMRGYGYPIPDALRALPLRVVVDSPRGAAWPLVRLLRRGSVLTLCSGLFDVALTLARGEHEVLVVDLDSRDCGLVGELISALRAQPETASLWLIGLSKSRALRERFLALGGDAALSAGQERDVRWLARWAIGAEAERPARAELRN